MEKSYKQKCDKYNIKIKKLLEKKQENIVRTERCILKKNEEKLKINWVDINKKVRSSIVQIFVSIHNFDPLKPYIFPGDNLARGSGFIIYNKENRILILTNAHVITSGNIINIRTEDTQGENLRANVINICDEKDIALLEIVEEDLKYFNKLPDIVELEDSRKCNDTIEVLTAGYPLGEINIKFTTGVLSGNQQKYDLDYDRKISYLQIDAPINAGNSGGPLFNKKGNVIGINSAALDDVGIKNVCYAIPSNIIISVIYDLVHNKLNNKLLKLPNINFKWNNCNKDIFEFENIKKKELTGIYIYNINNESSLKLKKGDILYKILINDISDNIDLFDIEKIIKCKNIDNIYKKTKKIEIFINNKGLIKIYYENTKEEHFWTKNRRVNIDEFLDTIPNNLELELFIIRNNKELTIKSITNNQIFTGIKKSLPMYKNIDWEICLGCCITELTLDILKIGLEKDEDNNNMKLTKYLLDDNRKNIYICITHVFRDTDVYNTDIIGIDEICIIKKINNENINNMNDLRNILFKNKYQYLNIEFDDGKNIVVSDINSKAQIKDNYIYEQYKIHKTDFCKENWNGN